MTLLTRTEEMLVLMICKLGEDAYAKQIREAVKELTGKLYSIGGIYVPLDRLANRGLLRVEDVKATGDRLGRPKRKFTITAEGLEVLRKTRNIEKAMWDLPGDVLDKLKLA